MEKELTETTLEESLSMQIFITYQVMVEELRALFGAPHSEQQKAHRKMKKYVAQQVATLRALTPPCVKSKRAKLFPKYSVKDGKRLRAVPAKPGSKRGQHKPTTAKKLKPYQTKAVKEIIRRHRNKGQLLILLHGLHGAGKTFIANQLAKEMGLDITFCATTNKAAAHLNADTVQGLFALNFKQTLKHEHSKH